MDQSLLSNHARGFAEEVDKFFPIQNVRERRQNLQGKISSLSKYFFNFGDGEQQHGVYSSPNSPPKGIFVD